MTRESWLQSLDLPELLDLARAANKYSCLEVLQLVDCTLVAGCEQQAQADALKGSQFGTWLTVMTAPMRYQLACELHLDAFSMHVATFLGRNAHKVDLDRLACGNMAAVLRGARMLREHSLAVKK